MMCEIDENIQSWKCWLFIDIIFEKFYFFCIVAKNDNK